jgi:hypothetical protein
METTEKMPQQQSASIADVDSGTIESQERKPMPEWLKRFSNYGIELRGVTPVPDDERVDKRFWSVFFLWFTMSTNLLP